jgi:hypothetical protein
MEGVFGATSIIALYRHSLLNCRDAWNMFKGFPKNNAALAYVFIVSQLLDNPAGGSEGGGPGVGCFGAIVSTLK